MKNFFVIASLTYSVISWGGNQPILGTNQVYQYIPSQNIAQNQFSVYSTNLISGLNNKIDGRYNLVDGNSNDIRGHVNYLQGKSNQVNGDGNEIQGTNNKVNGLLNNINGAGNVVSGHANLVSDYGNLVEGTGNVVSGFGNSIESSGNVIIGAGNSVGKIDDSFMNNLYRSIMGTNVNMGSYLNSNLRGTASKSTFDIWA